MDISNELKELRIKKGLSVESACELLHLSKKALNEIETGKREPTLSELKAISTLYNVSIDDIIKKKRKKRKKQIIYKIKRKQLIGFNRYGMRQGVSVVVVPIIAFLTLCTMFIPGFMVSGQLVSLMKVMFLTNNVGYTILGALMFVIYGTIIIYWSVELALGNYFRARLKITNNVLLSIYSGITFALALTCILIFKSYVAFSGIFTYIFLFATPLIQIAILVIMNLDGGDVHDQIYTYHECDYSGYENRHWFMLGLSGISLLALCLMFLVSSYSGKIAFFGIDNSMFEMFFKSTDVFKLFIGGLGMGVLCFNVVYWIIICTLDTKSRRKTNTANNVLVVVMSLILLIDTIAMMSYFGVEYITIGGICLYTSMFLAGIYGLCCVLIININKKAIYVEDENGFHTIERVVGQKPGKILAYRFPPSLQYLSLVLIVALGVLAYFSKVIHFVLYFAIPLALLQIILLCFQKNQKYINSKLFIYGIIVNTVTALFNAFLLCFTLFNNLSYDTALAMPIVSGLIVVMYAWIFIAFKPIRESVN